MKVLVYDEKRAEPKRVVKLRLIENSDGVKLTVVDDDGVLVNGGTIATIHDNGYILIHSNLDPEIGLRIANSHSGIAITLPRS